jgi:nicotinamide-nucleotide adenylyltransferase
MVPGFDLVYTNNHLVVQLFSEAGIPVRKPLLYQRESYSGTVIRRLMLEGEAWIDLVPSSVARLIAGVRGVERLANVSKSDALQF